MSNGVEWQGIGYMISWPWVRTSSPKGPTGSKSNVPFEVQEGWWHHQPSPPNPGGSALLIILNGKQTDCNKTNIRIFINVLKQLAMCSCVFFHIFHPNFIKILLTTFKQLASFVCQKCTHLLIWHTVCNTRNETNNNY